jgi:hypothetical protein
MMVKPSHFRDGNDLATLGWLDGTWHWTIHRERQMRAPVVIISKVAGQDAREMPLVEDHYVVQALPADTPDQSLHIWVLPRTPWGDDDLLDAHVLDTLPKGCAIDAVPIAEEIPGRLVPRERFHDLLCRPRCCRVFGHVEVDDTAAFVRQHHQHEEYFTRHSRDDEEIEGDPIL